MKCPHCGVEFVANASRVGVGKDRWGHWFIASQVCPNEKCLRITLTLTLEKEKEWQGPGSSTTYSILRRWQVYPKGHNRPPCPPEVPPPIAEDYNEACHVLPDSAKASAALSRRCLQGVLRDAGGVTPGNLANEIVEVLKGGKLPGYISGAIDAVRNIGNFAAHPIKSTSTGTIVPVEHGEAEWNLEVLESLFDFYYVQPLKLAAKRVALDQKLTDAGKPPMK